MEDACIPKEHDLALLKTMVDDIALIFEKIDQFILGVIEFLEGFWIQRGSVTSALERMKDSIDLAVGLQLNLNKVKRGCLRTIGEMVIWG